MRLEDFAKGDERTKIQNAIDSLIGTPLPVRSDGYSVNMKPVKQALEAAGLTHFDLNYDHSTGRITLVPWTITRYKYVNDIVVGS